MSFGCLLLLLLLLLRWHLRPSAQINQGTVIVSWLVHAHKGLNVHKDDPYKVTGS